MILGPLITEQPIGNREAAHQPAGNAKTKKTTEKNQSANDDQAPELRRRGGRHRKLRRFSAY